MPRINVTRMWLWSAFAMVPSTWGCGSGGDGPKTDCDVPKLFEERCGGAACHEGGNPASGLDLASPGVGDRVANVAGTNCSGVLADPSNPTGSVIYTKVATAQPTCGAPMPIGRDPLDEAELTCLRDWISGLIPPLPPEVDAGDPNFECAFGDTRPCYTGPDSTTDVGACTMGVQPCVVRSNIYVWGACEQEVLPIPEQCSTAQVDEDCDGALPSCAGRDLWSIALARRESGENIRSVAVDSLDNVLLAGDFGGDEGEAGPDDDAPGVIDLGGGPLTSDGPKDDVFLAKLDRNGNHIWSKKFGDTSTQNSTKVIVDANDNVILLGRFFGKINFSDDQNSASELDGVGTDDIFVAKFDKDGKHQWSKKFGGADADRAERVTTDSSGDVWIAGTFTGAANFGFGPVTSAGIRDVIILKLSGASGDALKAIPVGGGIVDPEDMADTGDDYGFGIDVDANDNVFVTGYFSNTMSFPGGGDLTSAGGQDVFVAKLNSNGGHVWSERFGGAQDDWAYDLKVDKTSGEVVITGFFEETIDFGGSAIDSNGSSDMFLAKLTNDGGHVFSAGYGDAQAQRDFGTFYTNTWLSLDLDATGNIYLAGPLVNGATFGVTQVKSAGGMDAFVAKFAANGTVLFGKPFGTPGTEIGLDIAATNSGHVMLVGRFYTSELSFGSSGKAIGIGGTVSGGDGFAARLSVN